MKKRVFAVVLAIAIAVCCVAIAEDLYSSFNKGYKELTDQQLMDISEQVRIELLERNTGLDGQRANVLTAGYYEVGDTIPEGQYLFVVKSVPRSMYPDIANYTCAGVVVVYGGEYDGSKGCEINVGDQWKQFSLTLKKGELLKLPENIEFYVMRDEIAF